MHTMLRLPLLCGLLLHVAAPLANAEGTQEDPFAPAVVGRPIPTAAPSVLPPEKRAAAKPTGPAHTTARPAQKPVKPRYAASAPSAQGTQRTARKTVDDRADRRPQVAAVGQGMHLGRKPLPPGAYIGDRHRGAVRQYYDSHPVAGAGANWRVGEPVPRGAPLASVPPGLLASLPPLPPGHRYVQLGGEVVLIAGSGMVVDGVPRSGR